MTTIKETVELANCGAVKANNIMTNNVIRILEIRDSTADWFPVTPLVVEDLSGFGIEIMDA